MDKNPTLASLGPLFCESVSAGKRLRPATVRAYGYDLRQLAGAFPGSLDQISLSALEAYLGDLHPSTAQRRIASLRRFFAWAVREGYAATSPLLGLERQRGERRLPRPIRTQAERATIDSVIAAAPQPHRMILTILRETGMRAGEVLALRLGDVVLESGREAIRVQASSAKNHHERVVVLGPHATPKSLRGLRAHLRERGGQPAYAPLFPSNRGTAMSYAALYKVWCQGCAAAGLVTTDGKPLYTLHQLRHTRGTELVEQGQPQEIIQRVLGHLDPRSTQGYAELHEGAVRAALEGRR